MRARPGSSLLELLTAATLLTLVTAASAVLMHAGAVVLRNTAERAVLDETLRTADGIVRAEIRPLTSLDVRSVSSDSVAARIARGVGIVCDTTRQSAVLRYRGLRLPDSAKDSLLVAGEERVTTFRTISEPASRCVPQADEQVLAVQPNVPLRPGLVVLFFESGAYHIATHALRYRRGNESRQPITDELLDDRASRFMVVAQNRGVRLLLRANSTGLTATSDSRFRLLNP